MGPWIDRSGPSDATATERGIIAYRTRQLLPDEDVEFTVTADGCREWKRRFKLPEGKTETVEVVLEPAGKSK